MINNYDNFKERIAKANKINKLTKNVIVWDGGIMLIKQNMIIV